MLFSKCRLSFQVEPLRGQWLHESVVQERVPGYRYKCHISFSPSWYGSPEADEISVGQRRKMCHDRTGVDTMTKRRGGEARRGQKRRLRRSGQRHRGERVRDPWTRTEILEIGSNAEVIGM